MKLYINGKEEKPEGEVGNSEAYLEATIGGDFYYGFENSNYPKIPLLLIYKGWNSLHFITKHGVF